jgi:uncharacterized integral membrane protein
MSSIEMKEIRVPSTLILERRPSFVYTILKSCATALALAVMSFFVLNVSAIAVLAILAAVQHKEVDFSTAYRYFAAPSALIIFVIALIGSLVFFFRERSR